jgi:hypothetical protein
MKRFTLVFLATMLLPTLTGAYPLDGYKETGIRRVEGARLANEGIVPGRKQPAGALLSTDEVNLRLLNHPNMDLPPPDPAFSKQLVRMLGSSAANYGIAVLDISDPAHPVYGEHRGDYRQNTGSVGKLIVALGLFQALADAWPDNLDKRREILKNTIVTADDFSVSDHHKIRVFNVEKSC